MTLGNLIRLYREEHDYSQRQFANICGLSNGYIAMLENGKNPKTDKPITPTLQQLKKLADAMGITMMEMLDRVDDMPVDIATETNKLSQKATSALNGESGCVDAIDFEIVMLVLQLPQEKKQEALNYLRYLASN